MYDAWATIVLPGRARRGASGSLNPQSAIAGPRTARGAESSGVWAGARSVDSQVPRIGSLRTASGPEGSSAKQCLPGAAEQPGSSKRRRRRPGDSQQRRPRDRAFCDTNQTSRAGLLGSSGSRGILRREADAKLQPHDASVRDARPCRRELSPDQRARPSVTRSQRPKAHGPDPVFGSCSGRWTTPGTETALEASPP